MKGGRDSWLTDVLQTLLLENDQALATGDAHGLRASEAHRSPRPCNGKFSLA
jgi:hypothetical protein